MKILLLAWNYPPVRGGIEYLVHNLFLHLRALGHEVRLVTSHADVPPEPDIHRAPAPGLKRYVRFSLTRGLSLARSFRPDAILCGSLVTAPAAWAISRLFRRPYFVIIHGSDILRPGAIYQRSVRFLLRRATGLIANSENTRRLLESAGMRPDRITVIYPGVRVEDFAAPPSPPSPEIEQWCAGRRILLAVGRLIRRKGILEFVESVMPELSRRHPDVRLLVVGDDATTSLVHAERMRDHIQAAIDRLSLQDHVLLLGALDDRRLLELFFKAHLFVMPNLDLPGDVEGFGIVLLEAALAGVPAVATRTGGIPEAVLDNVTGLLCPPNNPPALLSALSRLLDDPALHASLAAAAAHRARTQFSWPTIASHYAEIVSGRVLRY